MREPGAGEEAADALFADELLGFVVEFVAELSAMGDISSNGLKGVWGRLGGRGCALQVMAPRVLVRQFQQLHL